MKNNRLIELRKEAKLTQNEVAEILNVTQSTISKVERGLARLDREFEDKLLRLYGGEYIINDRDEQFDYEAITKLLMDYFGHKINLNDYMMLLVRRPSRGKNEKRIHIID